MPNETEQRAAILAAAREFLGAHYLAGTFGAIPNVPDTYAPDRNITMVPVDWAWPTIAVGTAEITYEGRRLRCCGRYGATEVGGARHQDWGRYAPLPGGDFGAWMASVTAPPPRPQPVPPPYARLLPQLQANATSPRTALVFAGFQGHLFPRRHCFVNHGEYENPDWLYLGEHCSGKHHFDCVGFVCRVLGTALGRTNIRYGLPGNSGCGNWLQLGNTDLGDSPASCIAASPGDVFISASHVALVYDRGNNIRLIHADGDSKGVEISGFIHPSQARTRTSWDTNFHVIHLSRTFLGASEEMAA